MSFQTYCEEMRLLGVEPAASFDDGQNHSKVLRLEDFFQVVVKLGLVPMFELEKKQHGPSTTTRMEDKIFIQWMFFSKNLQ